MILSHRHEFIYLRTRKTGSTSLEIALSSLCGDDDVITSVCPRDEGLRATLGGRPPQNLSHRNGVLPYNHMTAEQVRDFTGSEIWNRYTKFTVERDPYEKVVSLYYHRYKTATRPTMDEFISSGEAADAFNLEIYAIHGKISVDLLGNYGRLDEFLVELEHELGVQIPKLGRAKSQFREDQRRASDILTDVQRERIVDVFGGEPKFNGKVSIRLGKYAD